MEPGTVRYCDDFIILSSDQHHLKCLIDKISQFLSANLQLELHPKKVILQKLRKGIDFVGYVFFPHHRLMRTKTKQRMKKRLKKTFKQILEGDLELRTMDQQLQSCLGILSHANQHRLSQALKNAYWVLAGSCDTT